MFKLFPYIKRRNKDIFTFIVALVLFGVFGLVSGYFMKRANISRETKRNAVVENHELVVSRGQGARKTSLPTALYECRRCGEFVVGKDLLYALDRLSVECKGQEPTGLMK